MAVEYFQRWRVVVVVSGNELVDVLTAVCGGSVVVVGGLDVVVVGSGTVDVVVVEGSTVVVVSATEVVVGSTEVVVGSTVVVVDCSVVVVSTVVVVVVAVVCGTGETLVDTSYDTPSYQRFGSPQQTPALSLYDPGSTVNSSLD